MFTAPSELVKPRPAPAWMEAVFHVLAHVDCGPIAASCFDPRYVAWARRVLGPAEERTLAEDAAVLARVRDHEAFARLQRLAWHADEGANPFAGVLRSAAELEVPLLAKTPRGACSVDALGALGAATIVAPELVQYEVLLCRALPFRGRVLDGQIVIGAPPVAGATAAHIGWQAAHEAIVASLTGEHAEVERRAIVRLRSRARAAGLGREHGRWLATLDLRTLGPIPDIDDGADDPSLDRAVR